MYDLSQCKIKPQKFIIAHMHRILLPRRHTKTLTVHGKKLDLTQTKFNTKMLIIMTTKCI